jgi:hypothetical protein
VKHRPNGLQPIKAFPDQTEIGLNQPTHESGELVRVLQDGCLTRAENEMDGLRDSMAD